MTIRLPSRRSNDDDSAWQASTRKAPWWSAGAGTHAGYVNGEVVHRGADPP